MEKFSNLAGVSHKANQRHYQASQSSQEIQTVSYR